MIKLMTWGVTFALALLMAFSLLKFVQQADAAQQPAQEDAGKPRAPAPKRDLTGVWMLRNPPSMRSFMGASFTKEEPELTPWALDKYKEAKNSNNGKYTLESTNDPVITRCYPPGTPRVYFHPYPFEFVKADKYWLMLFEYDHTNRRIYSDGRPLPTDPDPTWMGYSVGQWSDDHTFVVETVGLNEKTWLDRLGHPHSDQLKVTETFRRQDMDHLQIDFKFEDPKALLKPWTATFYAELRPGWELGEISCSGDYMDFSKFEK
jgi:hypothetical protein